MDARNVSPGGMRNAWNEYISFGRGERVTMDLFVSIREEDETLRSADIN